VLSELKGLNKLNGETAFGNGRIVCAVGARFASVTMAPHPNPLPIGWGEGAESSEMTLRKLVERKL